MRLSGADMMAIARINRHAITPFGELRSAVDQYGMYAYALGGDAERAAREFLPLVLVPNCSSFGIRELEGLPLVADAISLERLRGRKGGGIEDLSELAGDLWACVACFQDPVSPERFHFASESEGSYDVVSIDVVEGLALVRRAHGRVPGDDLERRIGASALASCSIHLSEDALPLACGLAGGSGAGRRETPLAHIYCSLYPLRAMRSGLYDDASLEWVWDNELPRAPLRESGALRELVLACDWPPFPAGTPIQEVWAWFGARHSGGLDALAHGGARDLSREVGEALAHASKASDLDAWEMWGGQ